MFKNNLPGNDWKAAFKKRHKLTTRFTQNVKPTRAQAGPEAIKSFYERLEKVLEGMEADNIYNYDDTIITDDPGNKSCIISIGH